jgi:hypothetical protein
MFHQEERQATTTVECKVITIMWWTKIEAKGIGGVMEKQRQIFFNNEDTSTTIDNVRESRRIKKRRDMIDAAVALAQKEEEARRCREDVLETALYETIDPHAQNATSSKKKKRSSKIEQNPEDGNGIPSAPFMLRPPESGVRCAGRHDTTRLLWLHEYYVVHEGTVGKATKSIYQALQFMLGVHIPDGVIPNMTELMRRSIWVLGIRYVAAAHVQQYRDGSEGYIFHTEYNDEDARTCLFGTCPEVVRVENCLKWHEMKNVSTEVPRVVHAEDVHNRRLHVAGRANHYVCGVTAVEDLVTHTYSLARLPRIGFCMYPKERLGMEINSPSMMWEHIEEIFTKTRICMSAARQGTSSATFSMPLLCTVYAFWQVSHLVLHIN